MIEGACESKLASAWKRDHENDLNSFISPAALIPPTRSTDPSGVNVGVTLNQIICFLDKK